MKIIRKYLPITTTLLISFVLFFLIPENISRTIVIFVLVWAWYFLGRYLKNYFISSIVLLAITFPLNITVNINGLFDPYVKGVITNYLIPHISILDLSLFLVILSVFIDEKVFVIKWYALVLIGILFLSLLFHLNFISFVLFLRYSLYSIAALLICENRYWIGKNIKLVSYTLFLSLLLQFGISIFQFCTSSTLGLSFLGESQLVSGSIGSSFVNIGGGQYLRAYGTFTHPNVLAGFALFSLILFLSIRREKITLISILISLSLLALTLSRLHIVLGIFLVIASLVSGKKIFSVLILDRFASIFGGNDISLNERGLLFKSAISHIQNDFWGVGQGLYVRIFEENPIRTTSGLLLLQPVHNIFLLYISEHGIILGSLLILLLLFRLGQKFLKRNIFSLAILATIFCIAFFDHYLATLPQGIFLLMLGIV